MNGIQEVSGSIPLISTKVHRERFVSKETSLFSYVCFVDWHIPATQAHSPMGRSDFLNAPFFMPIFRYHHNRKEFSP